jgi:sterol desaturase/sphingolipid hydroxylase (fatty acid hydroxylase superfamily)
MSGFYYFLSFLGGIFLVEFVGYFWHRWVEHKEVLGKSISFRHYKHHEVQYPVNNLRTNGPYESADSWTWYTVGIVTTIIAFIFLPLWCALTFTSTAWIYAHFIVATMHSAFHLTGGTHFLWKFKWFQKLVKLHDIHHYDNCNYGICFFFMDKLFGTYREDFPTDKEGNRVKMNVFQSYPFRRGHDGNIIRS